MSDPIALIIVVSLIVFWILDDNKPPTNETNTPKA